MKNLGKRSHKVAFSIEEKNKIAEEVEDSYEEIAQDSNYYGEADQVKKGGEIMDTYS
jgi:hypothetical protein